MFSFAAEHVFLSSPIEIGLNFGPFQCAEAGIIPYLIPLPNLVAQPSL